MTRSNRTLNRVILAVLGLLVLGAAAAIAVLAVDPALLDRLDPRVLAATEALRATIASVTAGATVLWAIAAGCAVLIALALAWILTRGRGRTSTSITAGGVELDVRVVQQLLQHELASTDDIVGVRATAYRSRQTTVVRVRIDVRRGADLVRLMAAVDGAIDRLDRTLGSVPPVLVHIATGFRTALSREHRAA